MIGTKKLSTIRKQIERVPCLPQARTRFSRLSCQIASAIREGDRTAVLKVQAIPRIAPEAEPPEASRWAQRLDSGQVMPRGPAFASCLRIDGPVSASRRGRRRGVACRRIAATDRCAETVMSKSNTTAGEWSKSVAAMAVDALVDAGLVSKPEFKAACDVVAEEIYVRLCLNDYPPPVNHNQGDEAAELLKRRQP